MKKIDAEILAEGENCYLEKSCPEHGPFRTIVWKGGAPMEQWIIKKKSGHRSKNLSARPEKVVSLRLRTMRGPQAAYLYGIDRGHAKLQSALQLLFCGFRRRQRERSGTGRDKTHVP